MRILIVGQAEHQYLRLKEEGEKRGHEVENCNTRELIITADQNDFDVQLKKHNISRYDVLYLLTLGDRKWDWFVAAQYLHKKFGTIIVNEKIVDSSYSYFLTSTTDYWKQSDLHLPFPKSAVIFSKSSVKEIAGDFDFPVIVKHAGSRKGKGVFKIGSVEELETFVETHKKLTPSFIVRELIPNDGDVRVFCVGYKAIGAMKRTPHEGDFRSNISQGGMGEPFDLKKNLNVRDIAQQAAEATRTEIAGVDIIINKETGEPYILEINNGPQFVGLEEYTDTNAAEEIIKYFEQKHKKI